VDKEPFGRFSKKSSHLDEENYETAKSFRGFGRISSFFF
jgi:hypothetical protein